MSKYATALLHTDTIAFDVIRETEHTVTLRERGRDFERAPWPDELCDPGAYGLTVMWHATVSVPTNPEKTYRRRKRTGDFRLGLRWGVIRFTDTPPAVRTDMRQ